MKEEVTTYIDVKSNADLRKLEAKVAFVNVEYRPSVKKGMGNFKLSIVYPSTEYRYGTLRILGDATVSETVSLPLEKADTIKKLTDAIVSTAQDELNQIKSEVQALLASGVPLVTIDLNDALNRVFTKCVAE